MITQGEIALIKIGIECTFEKLRSDLLSHPHRYFFVLLADNQATLCIRTCNSRGEEIIAHIIDGLVSDSNGDLTSVFEEGIKTSLREQEHFTERCCEREEYLISSLLEEEITMMPGLIDWIMTSILTEDRHILLNPSWAIH
jgi:hypothetical protein